MRNYETIKAELLKGCTTNHAGKMAGMWSFSTNSATCAGCNARRKNPLTVCANCYAADYIALRPALGEKLDRNTALVCTEVLPAEAFPYVNCKVFRFEAFGETRNAIQAENYMRWAEKNPETTFSVWTKEPRHYAKAMQDNGRETTPDNFILIYSSPFINDSSTAGLLPEYDFIIDKVFTVYAAEYALRYGVNINCGARNCAQCGKCYNWASDRYIGEVLKSDSSRYYKALNSGEGLEGLHAGKRHYIAISNLGEIASGWYKNLDTAERFLSKKLEGHIIYAATSETCPDYKSWLRHLHEVRGLYPNPINLRLALRGAGLE